MAKEETKAEVASKFPALTEAQVILAADLLESFDNDDSHFSYDRPKQLVWNTTTLPKEDVDRINLSIKSAQEVLYDELYKELEGLVHLPEGSHGSYVISQDVWQKYPSLVIDRVVSSVMARKLNENQGNLEFWMSHDGVNPVIYWEPRN